MNIYLYQGENRMEMGDNFEDYDNTILLHKEYTIDMDIGMVLIAYPNEYEDADF